MPTPSVARSRSPAAASASCLPSPVEELGLITHDAFPSSSLSITSLSDEAVLDLNSNVPPEVATKAPLSDNSSHNAQAHARSGTPWEAIVPPNLMSMDSSNTPAEGSAEIKVAPSREPTASPPQPDPQAQLHFPPRFHALALSSQNHTLPSSTRLPLSQAEWEVTGPRIRPSITSSLFRPGSRFVGTQKSDKATYQVSVELKYIDMAQSFCCGFLTIDGLTEHLPSITTYFEGEFIGTRHSFSTSTQHPTWGASDKTDLAHWSRFAAFRPLHNAAKAHRHHDPEFANRSHLFMRWKEMFLVPDHKQKDLPGASFEGFYYICFNQGKGNVEGIYFHARSEKFQRLELEYVRDPWKSTAMEFR